MHNIGQLLLLHVIEEVEHAEYVSISEAFLPKNCGSTLKDLLGAWVGGRPYTIV